MMLFSLAGPMSISIWGKLSVIMMVLSFIYCVLFLKQYKKEIDSTTFFIITPLFLYLAMGLISFSIVNYSKHFYYTEGLITRLVNYALLLSNLIVIFLLDGFRKEKFLKISYYFIFIFIVGGGWQIVSFLTNPNLFPFETRSWVHGASNSFFSFRVTSFTREPNFFAPLVIEFIILTYALYGITKKSIVVMGVALVIGLFTLSGGFYAHLLIMILILTLYTDIRYKLKIFFLVSFSIFLLYIYADQLFYNAWDYLIQKFNTESSGGSSRSQVQVETFIYFLSHSNLKQLIFGYGFGSMMFASDLVNLTGTVNDDFRITNNLYLDFLWEIGFLGLTLCIFCWLVAGVFIYRLKDNRYKRSSLFLFISVLISSLYRSEYVTAHYFVILSCVLILIELSRKSHKSV